MLFNIYNDINLINNIRKKTTYLILFIIITIYIFIQFISISQFCYNYITSYIYGDMLKKNCKNKNTEYETGRYQLYNKILKNLLNNDIDNKTNYIIILSIVILFSIIFSIIFTIILYIFINDIKKTNINDLKFKFLCNFLIILTCIISLCYLPIYIGVRLDNKDNNKFKNIINYILYGFIILCAIILLLYYSTYNKYNEYTYSSILLITLIICFIGFGDFMKLIINYYKENKLILDYKYKDVNNFEDKKKIILKKYNDDNNDNDNYNDNDNDNDNYIISKYLINTLGLKFYYNKILDKDYNNLNLYIFILQIMLIVLGIIFLINRLKGINEYYNGNINFNQLLNCLFYKDNLICKYFIYNSKESKILYQLIFTPLLIILILFIVINATINFNTNINKYIILKPLIIYKKELNNINNNFQNLIHNDDKEYRYILSVEKNIANSILLVLYNEIFSDFLSLNDTEDSKYDDYYRKYINDINITPEFHFTFIDNKNNEKINYNELKEYQINYYLNNKYENKDIYKNNNINKKCDNENKFIIYYILKSIFLYEPIASLSKTEKTNIEKYEKYRKILEYKIYKAINNIKKGEIYLGNDNLNRENNHIINNKLDIKFNDPLIDIKELKNLLSIEELIKKNSKFNNKRIQDIIKETINYKTDNIDVIFDNLIDLKANNNIPQELKIYFNIERTLDIKLLEERILNLKSNEISKENLLKLIDKLLQDSSLNDADKNIINEYIDRKENKNIIIRQIIKLKKDTRLLNKLDIIDNILILSKYEYIINDIINAYLQYIIDIQEIYYHIFFVKDDKKDSKCSEDDDNCLLISDIDIKNKFKNEEINDPDIKIFINKYKEILINQFTIINNYLTNYKNENYTNNNKLKEFILTNYYHITDDNNAKINLEQKNIINIEFKDDVDTLNKYKKIEKVMTNILLSFYFNHYFIMKINNLYNSSEIDDFISNIKSLYNREDKDISFEENYIILINKLTMILNIILYNNDNNMDLRETDKIFDKSLNNTLIDNIIKFNNKYSNERHNINISINNIKKFLINENDISLIDTDTIIDDDYLNDTYGINNKIKLYEKYVSLLEIENDDYNIKNKTFINNIFQMQQIIFNELSSNLTGKININKIIKDYNYEDKFNTYIEEYTKFNNTIFKNNDNEIIKKDNIINDNLITNIKNSKKSKNEVDKTSLSITVLILIYIISYITIRNI